MVPLRVLRAFLLQSQVDTTVLADHRTVSRPANSRRLTRGVSACAVALVIAIFGTELPAAEVEVAPDPTEMAESSRAPTAVDEEPLPAPAEERISAALNSEPLPGQPIVETNGSPVSSTERKLHYRASVTVRTVYDDNVNLGSTDRIDDVYTTIEPTVTVGYGDTVSGNENFLQLSYTPALFLFANHSENNALQHLVRADAQYRLGRLTLGFGQDVQILDGSDLNVTTGTGTVATRVNLDVAGRTRLNIYSSRLTGSYDLTGKLFVTGALQFSDTEYPNLISNQLASGNLYLNYNYSPKLVLGAGFLGGYQFVESPSPDQSFEQVNLRVGYQATGKINLNATAGVELRQFAGAQAINDTEVSPVFEIGLNYQPFDATNVALSATRRTMNSAVLGGQDFKTTGVILSLRQRFLQRFYTGVTFAYEHSEYFNTLNGVVATREDDYFSIQPTVDFDVTRFWSIGIFYLYRENNSNTTSSFDGNQIGFRTTLTF